MIGGVQINLAGRLITVRESVTQPKGAVIEFGDMWVALTPEEVEVLRFSLEAHQRWCDKESTPDDAAEAFGGHDDESM